ncbi:MAG: IS1634 family transposase [Ignavibacteriales bacterium]|nr:IS1634 family transposase [Ignavibacteriales bacterium]
MFVRKKKNKSGSISIQIIDKNSGGYKVIQTVGCSDEMKIVEQLYIKAKQQIKTIGGQQQFNFEVTKEKDLVDIFFNSIDDFKLVGPELLLGKIFDQIGFNKIKDELFRYLVITRLVYPVSKLKTVDYLYKYKGISFNIDKVYRYLDKLHKQQMQLVQQIGYRYALDVFQGEASVVFYDVTTLYFEAEDEDDLRKMGFSKDGKHQQPQIVLGLLVNEAGFPLGYEIFEGNKFEGHTMLSVVESFKKKYKIEQLVVVADCGLMSKENINELIEKGYEFIVGSRIKNESKVLKTKILALRLADGKSAILQKQDGQTMIISYCTQRAKKDEYNRKRGLEKLKKSVSTGKLTKKQISNKGYNKYLKLDGEATVTIDYDKFNDDAKWDGLKGYLTNTKLSKEEVIAQYKQLWQIEKTFRISKTDLRIRPVFHYLKHRIEAHVCISFAACVVYKELERQLKNKNSALSPEKTIDILKTIYSITIMTPYSKSRYTRLLIKNEQQEDLLNLFGIAFGCPNA